MSRIAKVRGDLIRGATRRMGPRTCLNVMRAIYNRRHMKKPTQQAINRVVTDARDRSRRLKSNARNFATCGENDRAADARRIAMEYDAVADFLEAVARQ